MQDKQILPRASKYPKRQNCNFLFTLFLEICFSEPEIVCLWQHNQKRILNNRSRHVLVMHLLVHTTKEQRNLTFVLVNYYNIVCWPCLEFKTTNTVQCQAIWKSFVCLMEKLCLNSRNSWLLNKILTWKSYDIH